MRSSCLESDTDTPLPKDKIEQKDIWRDNKGVGGSEEWARIDREDRGQWEKYQFESLSVAAALLNIQFIELWSNPVEVSLAEGRLERAAGLEYTLHYATLTLWKCNALQAFDSLVHK